MSEAYMKLISARYCEHRECAALAEYSVYGSRGTHFGDFCATHAEQKCKSLDAFYSTAQALNEPSVPPTEHEGRS